MAGVVLGGHGPNCSEIQVPCLGGVTDSEAVVLGKRMAAGEFSRVKRLIFVSHADSRPVVVRVAGRWLTNCAQSGNEVGDAGACALAHGLRSNRILLELDLVSCVIAVLPCNAVVE